MIPAVNLQVINWLIPLIRRSVGMAVAPVIKL